MNGIRGGFEVIRFTEEEKKNLAARLQQAAEQEGTMTDTAKKRVRKLSRGVVMGIAAALILTMGTLAAVMNGAWGGLFSLRSSEEQALLETLTYEIGETKTVDGWEITLSRCAGDDTMLYFWIEMKAPKDFTGEPPKDYLNLSTNWDLMKEGKWQEAGSNENRFDWDEETRTVTYWSSGPTGNSVAGKTGDLVLEPLRWEGWDPETDKWVRIPIWEGDVVFEDVELAYPDQTIRLTPNAEVPYLDGTATLTKLEFSPFRAFARVDGGSCYFHHHYWVKEEDVPPQEEATTIPSDEGNFTITSGASNVGGLERDGYRLAYGTMDCWSQLEVAFHMKDGTVITPRTAVLSECQDGFDTEDHVYAGECYVERRMEYENTPLAGIPDRIIDPAQVDYVTVCGVDIPVTQ